MTVSIEDNKKTAVFYHDNNYMSWLTVLFVFYTTSATVRCLQKHIRRERQRGDVGIAPYRDGELKEAQMNAG